MENCCFQTFSSKHNLTLPYQGLIKIELVFSDFGIFLLLLAERWEHVFDNF